MRKGFSFYKEIPFVLDDIDYVASVHIHGYKDSGYLGGLPEDCREPELFIDYKLCFVDGVDISDPKHDEIYTHAHDVILDYIENEFQPQGV